MFFNRKPKTKYPTPWKIDGVSLESPLIICIRWERYLEEFKSEWLDTKQKVSKAKHLKGVK